MLIKLNGRICEIQFQAKAYGSRFPESGYWHDTLADLTSEELAMVATNDQEEPYRL